MARPNEARGRLPLTPSLKLPREQLHIEPATGASGPTSPPETPTVTPHMAGQSSQAGAFYHFSRPLAQDPSIKPVGNGHHFSYQRTVVGLEQLSPRSSSSSSDAKEASDYEASISKSIQPRSVANTSTAQLPDNQSDADGEHGHDDETGPHEDAEEDAEEEEEEEEEEGNGDDDFGGDGGDGGCDGSFAAHQVAYAGPSLRLASDEPSLRSISVAGSDVDDARCQSRLHAASSSNGSVACGFVIEDMDPMDSGCEGVEILHPTEIESNRSRSKSRQKEFDRGMVRDFRNLNCGHDSSDNEDGRDEMALFWQRQREIRRIRRVSMSSSIGKRTHSELSDSDESEAGALDVNEVGSSARRMRKRLHRGSLLFQDPPAPRIDELEEPDSSEEELDAADAFARELPYWTMEIMEMDST
ncbi:hypothetical protein E4U41_002802 [Claviceps citrina]|nr:hypothetical protein E4U41_002802 [Claviceps citrina]